MGITIPHINIPERVVVNLYEHAALVSAGATVGDQLKIGVLGDGAIRVNYSAIKPTIIDSTTGYTLVSAGSDYVTIPEVVGLHVYSHSGCTISLEQTGQAALPSGLFTGKRAVTVQSYREANVKNGLEFEGSTLLTMPTGTINDTIFLTGALPVVLKSRSISWTGAGVIAEVFELPTYTGGTSVAYQNANANFVPAAAAVFPAVGLITILVGATVTDSGMLKFAPVHGIGNTSNQGQGATNQSINDEHIFKVNTPYLLRQTTLDGGTQKVSSFLTWYEGELDLPR